ncbi:MAG: glyceraldehyde-3-phosphate dehydrogenase, partial [Endozoicomonadaceae bacterium]|nr:glyceraldehyde-3-phosphate dehydrogenase [Endozoicomonadaceae bacterium]
MQQATVEAMIPLIGKLYREQQIICSVFGRSLINRSVSNILQTHQYTKAEQGNKLDVKDTLAFIKILLE